MSEQSERNFFLNVYGRSFWRFVFCEPYISATRKLIIFKQKPKDAYFSKLRPIKFSKKCTKPGEHEFYSNRENFSSIITSPHYVLNILPKPSNLSTFPKYNHLTLSFQKHGTHPPILVPPSFCHVSL